MDADRSVRAGWLGSGFLRRLLAVLGLTALVAVTLLVVWAAHQVLLVVFLGALLGIVLDGLGGLVTRVLPVSRWWAVRGLLVLLVALAAVAAWIWGDDLVRQFAAMFRELPSAVSRLRDQLAGQPWTAAVAERLPDPAAMMSRVDLGRLTGAFSTVLGGLTSVFIVLFVGVYAGMSPRRYVDAVAALVPPAHRDRGMEVLRATHRALQSWLLGRLADMTVLAVVTALGLFLLGVPFAVPLGITAGLLAFVPYVGPLLSVVPAVLVALNVGGSAVLQVIVLYGAIQLVESYLLTPLIDQRAVDVPPALGLAVQALLGTLAGAIGVVVAVPLTVVAIVLVQTLYIEEGLQEEVDVIGADGEAPDG